MSRKNVEQQNLQNHYDATTKTVLITFTNLMSLVDSFLLSKNACFMISKTVDNPFKLGWENLASFKSYIYLFECFCHNVLTTLDAKKLNYKAITQAYSRRSFGPSLERKFLPVSIVTKQHIVEYTSIYETWSYIS